MALLLALETSSPVCSVALFQDSQLLGVSELRAEKSHSSHLTVLIDQLLANTGHSKSDLSGVVVSGGPGSYTGLRIGGATAKGLCYALDIPLVEVSTLQSMAKEVIGRTPNPASFLYCPMQDARRLEVYTCLLNHQLQEVQPVAPEVLTPHSFAEPLQNGQMVFFGSGASKWRDIVGGHPRAFFLEEVVPNAKFIGELGLFKFQAGDFEDLAYYEPFYLKEVYITKSN